MLKQPHFFIKKKNIYIYIYIYETWHVPKKFCILNKLHSNHTHNNNSVSSFLLMYHPFPKNGLPFSGKHTEWASFQHWQAHRMGFLSALASTQNGLPFSTGKHPEWASFQHWQAHRMGFLSVLASTQNEWASFQSQIKENGIKH